MAKPKLNSIHANWDGVLPFKWTPRPYQAKLWDYLANGGKRATIIWHRRGGKDITAYNYMISQCVSEPGTYWHVFPNYSQGKKAIFEGRTSGKGERESEKDVRLRYLDFIPEQIRDTRNGSTGINESELLVKFHPDIGSSIYRVIGGDNPESLVGSGIKGVIFSEYDLMPSNTFNLIQPMLKESGGWAIFAYTPHGRNHGYDHWERVRQLGEDKHYAQILTVEDTQKWTGYDIDELIEEARAEGLSEEKIQSEYFCSFDAPMEGSIFGADIKQAEDDGRIGNWQADPDLPVNTAWDWGQDDHCCIWFFQIHGDDIVFIDYMIDNNKGMPEYVSQLRARGYHYGAHYVPHDMAVRETNGLTRIENAMNYGIRLDVVPRVGIPEKIEAGRSLLRRCKINKIKCYEGIANLRSYSREFDEKFNRFSDKPKHDYASHTADAFMEAAKMTKWIKTTQNVPMSRNYLQNRNPYTINI